MSATPRQILAEADRYRRLANGARGIRACLRVGGEKAGHKGGVLGWLSARRNEKPAFEPFDGDMALALDIALGNIAVEYERTAKRIEAQVTTEGQR